MGLVLGLSLVTGFGALVIAFFLAREAFLLWTRFHRKPAAAFFALLSFAAGVYAGGAIVVAVNVMEFGNFFDLFPKNLI